MESNAVNALQKLFKNACDCFSCNDCYSNLKKAIVMHFFNNIVVDNLIVNLKPKSTEIKYMLFRVSYLFFGILKQMLNIIQSCMLSYPVKKPLQNACSNEI